MAIVRAIDHFKLYLYGRQFKVVSDHQPLKWLFTVRDPAARLARWLISLEKYSFTISYKQGSKNGNADALSRWPLEDSAEPVVKEEYVVCFLAKVFDTAADTHTLHAIFLSNSDRRADQLEDLDIQWILESLNIENTPIPAPSNAFQSELTRNYNQLRVIDHTLYFQDTDSLDKHLQRMYKIAVDNRDIRIERAKINHDRQVRAIRFNKGDKVWLHDSAKKKNKSKKLSHKWKGPYTVIQTGKVNYTIKNDAPKGRSMIVNVTRLKRCFGDFLNENIDENQLDEDTNLSNRVTEPNRQRRKKKSTPKRKPNNEKAPTQPQQQLSENLSTEIIEQAIDNETFEIDKIINHRKVGRGYQFLVRWKGYDEKEDKWIPTSYFVDKNIPENYLKNIEQHKTATNSENN